MSIYQDFAHQYIEQFIETVLEGCSGGIYDEKIKANKGKITDKDIKTFIRFQHGDNDYTNEYGRRGDRQLVDNPSMVAAAFIQVINERDNFSNERFSAKEIKNLLISLAAIANNV